MTTQSTPKTLAEFANNDRRDLSWLDQQPIWPDVVAGYHQGIKVTTIRRWLVAEHGFTDKQLPSAESIARHLRYNYPKDAS